MSVESHPSSPSKEQAIALLRSGLGAEIQRIAASYVMPRSWIFADHGSPLIPDNGSAFLLDAGEGAFLVTVAHVYRGFMAAKAEHPDAICIVGDERFPLEERLIAEDPLFDVATFRVEPTEVTRFAKAGKIALRGSNSAWPPGPPELGRAFSLLASPATVAPCVPIVAEATSWRLTGWATRPSPTPPA